MRFVFREHVATMAPDTFQRNRPHFLWKPRITPYLWFLVPHSDKSVYTEASIKTYLYLLEIAICTQRRTCLSANSRSRLITVCIIRNGKEVDGAVSMHQSRIRQRMLRGSFVNYRDIIYFKM